MKVVIDMHTSLNGMIADMSGGEDWLPHEGWVEFKQQAEKYGNIIMGRETYEIVTREYEENFDAINVALKVIVTSQREYIVPDGYSVVHTPEAAVMTARDKGMEVAYVIGGGKLNGSFMKRKLIDGLHITINPYVIGQGKPLFGDCLFENQLKLLAWKQTTLGRIVVDYEVVK